TEVDEVVQPGQDAGQVDDPVAITVREAARVDLVDHAVAPPVGAEPAARQRAGWLPSACPHGTSLVWTAPPPSAVTDGGRSGLTRCRGGVMDTRYCRFLVDHVRRPAVNMEEVAPSWLVDRPA